mgnify:CR=1 FL=1
MQGKRVLVRVDFNVPMQNGQVADGSRIKAALPTIALLQKKGAQKIILLTHLGRPEGKQQKEFSLAPIAQNLASEKVLGSASPQPDHFPQQGSDSYRISDSIELRENLRFDPREEQNDASFAQELAAQGDVYVNEAFSNSHRTHASMVSLPNLLPGYLGLQCAGEIEHLSEALTPPQGSVALVAVTKVDKFPLVEKLATLYHKVLVGGPVQSDYIPTAPNIEVPTDGIPERRGLLDIGPQTRAAYVQEVSDAPFVLWNGPLGWYEKGYTESTDAIARTIISHEIRAVIGGGDTVAAVAKFNFDPERVFISTGGGAMLQFLVDGTLPALEALKR